MSLFRRMLLEEFRLATRLFGSNRLAGFPVFIALVVGGGTYLLAATGTSLSAIVAGLHGLVFFFGLQTGTVGLVGRDAIRDLLGDVTLLVFSSRTLPLSWTRLVGTFLVKEVVYYAGLFLIPIAVGFAPVALLEGGNPARVGLLWLTMTATFALGASTSLTLVGLATRSKSLVLATVAALTAGAILTSFDPVSITPYAVYTDPGVTTAVRAVIPIVAFALAGPLVLRPVRGGGARRVRPDRWGSVQRFTGRGDGLATRPLLEVARSSGSVWKVAFSLGILFGVTALLLDRLVAATGIVPSAGIAFGTLLGLGTFTTYNWVTRFDDPAEFLRLPVPMSAVFAGKRRAFLLLAMPTGVAYLALATVWYPPVDLLLGVVIFPPVALYVFGLTVFLTGLAPNDLLFDTPRFAVFGAGLAAVAVPLLVTALAYGQAAVVAIGVAVSVAAISGLFGLVLARRAGPRWHDRLRTQH